MHKEQLEVLALRFLANGAGVHPVPDNELISEAIVAWELGAADRVRVFLRKDGQTKFDFEFALSAVPPTDHSAATSEIKRIETPSVPPPPPTDMEGREPSAAQHERRKRHRNRLLRRRRAVLELIRPVLLLCRGRDADRELAWTLLAMDRLVQQRLLTRDEHGELCRFLAEFVFGIRQP